jgi:hypothetical protein
VDLVTEFEEINTQRRVEEKCAPTTTEATPRAVATHVGSHTPGGCLGLSWTPEEYKILTTKLHTSV